MTCIKRISAAMLSLTVLLLTSCGSLYKPEKSDTPIITVTSFPLYDMAKSLVGEKANVVCLLSPGADSHDFDPSIKDIGNVADSALFIYCGNGLEAWAENLISGAGGNAKAVDVSEGIALLYHNDGEHDIEDEHTHGADPHIWTSPSNMLVMTDTVYNALREADLADEDGYNEYKASLEKLDKHCTELAELQKGSGKTLFFGDAFAFIYLMENYGFKYVSTYPGCSDDVEPSISRISEVTGLIAAEKPKAVFRAERSNGKIAASLAETADAEVLELHSCHNLTAEEYKHGETYFSLMSKNLDNIEKLIS